MSGGRVVGGLWISRRWRRPELSDPPASFGRMDLTGTLGVVTGAGAGLGRHLALGLADAGAGVVIADVDLAAARETAAHVQARGVLGKAVESDVRDPAEAHRLIRIAAEHGGPHVLINNAGGWTPGAQFPAAPAEAWQATMTLNLLAPMLLTQLVLGHMRALGGGAVVNIASSAGVPDTAYGSPEYAAAKAGLIRFTSSVAGLEATHGVRVTCVVPGWIGLPRAHVELAALPAAERAATPPLVEPADIVAQAVELIRSGRGGRVVRMLAGRRA
jgi:NAD(P)-dependent dehydrogenase (short-subunit alcohol dehydrogenase family)